MKQNAIRAREKLHGKPTASEAELLYPTWPKTLDVHLTRLQGSFDVDDVLVGMAVADLNHIT